MRLPLSQILIPCFRKGETSWQCTLHLDTFAPKLTEPPWSERSVGTFRDFIWASISSIYPAERIRGAPLHNAYIEQLKFHDVGVLFQPLFLKYLFTHTFEYFRQTGLIKNSHMIIVTKRGNSELWKQQPGWVHWCLCFVLFLAEAARIPPKQCLVACNRCNAAWCICVNAWQQPQNKSWWTNLKGKFERIFGIEYMAWTEALP